MTGAERAKLYRLRKLRAAKELTPAKAKELAALERRQKRPAALDDEGPAQEQLEIQETAKEPVPAAAAGTWQPSGEAETPPPEQRLQPESETSAAAAPPQTLLPAAPEAKAEAPPPDPEAVKRGATALASLWGGFVAGGMVAAVKLLDAGDVPEFAQPLFAALRDPATQQTILATCVGSFTTVTVRYGAQYLAHIDEVVVAGATVISGALMWRASQLPKAPSAS